MKHNLAKFNSAVSRYEKALSAYKGKSAYIAFDSGNEKAYYSIGPLSRAAHNLGMLLSVGLYNGKSKQIQVLLDTWEAFDALESGKNTKKTVLLEKFISQVDAKAKGAFRKIFRRPDIMMDANESGFVTSDGKTIGFQTNWITKYRYKELVQTAKIIWRQVFNIRPHEKVAIGFDLIAKAKDMTDPLEDYMDSYLIARAMFEACPTKRKTMKAVSSVPSMKDYGERTSDLGATLVGCELSKNIDEPIFKIFKQLSKEMKYGRLGTVDANFFIAGEGYGGRHVFGETIGYPTPNKKSRWSAPSGIIYQFPWQPQTKLDSRRPRTRLGFTDTLPIDVFIQACRLDWLKVKRKNDRLIRMVYKSQKIIVESEKTRLEVGVVMKNGEHRTPMNSDADARNKLDPPALRKGIYAGNMVNVPGGEIFVTPEYVKGIFYGDVVINIDKSHVLSSKEPVVVKCNGDKYEVLSGPKEIIKKLNEKKKESMKMLLLQEKHKSLPPEIIKMKKENYNRIGEFAINTNPKAQLCNYLIVNEKIAGMIHLALGSGYEADRSTVYHYDCVINAKEQKLDIYGVAKKGEKLWMMKKGKLCV